MSEMSESYEDLVKQLKPLSIKLERISGQRFAELKVVDDPNLIKDEVIVTTDVTINEELEEELEEEEEEEVEIDLKQTETQFNNEINEVCPKYLCFFCKKSLNGYKEALIHYQLHIDYYPIQCSLCDEANTDVLSFVKHCRRIHPELEKAKYVLKKNSVFFDWIHNFLTTEVDSWVSVVHKYCPLCDWTHLLSEKEESPPKAIAVIRHIHEHIQYMPFECIKCRENGRQYRVHYLDMTTRNHIMSEHKELEPPYWVHFSKKYTIPSLDKFIANYLTILGIKLPKKRRTKRKSKPIGPPVVVNTTSEPTVNGLLPNVIHIQPKPNPISTPLTFQNLGLPANQTITQNIGTNPVITNSRQLIQNNNNPLLMANPLMILPSNDKINLKPTYVESTELAIVCVDPETAEIDDKFFKYICIFCNDDKVYTSEIEMCLHYGIHLSYYPVVCMLCSKTFLDMSTLIYHYNTSHVEYKNNLFHYLKEDQKIEQWITSFVDYQKSHEFRGHVSVAFGDHCFVCQKLSKNETSFQMNCMKEETKVIRDHIHQHLHYFPYKCLICFHGNRTVRFTSFNTSAIIHMIKVHGLNLSQLSTDSLYKLLAKSDEILELENFVDNQMFPKRKSSQPTITLNLKRKLEEIETEAKKRLESSRLTPSTSLALPSAQVLPMIRNEENKPKVSFNCDKTPTSLLRMSTSVSPQKAFNGLNTMRVTPPVIKPIEYIPNRLTYIQPYLLCFHCHQKVSNTKELESHHQSKHPKLTIASYAPTRRDLMANH